MKTRLLKKILISASLLFGAGIIPLSGMAAPSAPLRFGVGSGYPPFHFIKPDGTLTGFDVDVDNALCKRLQRKCELVKLPFKALIPSLRAQKIDVINSILSVTTQRKKIIAFSRPIYVVPVKLTVKKGSNLEPNAKSLKGKRVGVEQGSTMETFANKHWAPKGVDVVPYPTIQGAWHDLVAGRVAATLQEAQTVTTGFLQKPQGADYMLASGSLTAPILNTPIAMGLRKDDGKLLAAVNKALNGMLADGTFQKIADKYFVRGNITFPKAK